MLTGWFCIGFSKSVKKYQLKAVSPCGLKLLLYRAHNEAYVTAALCPHQGVDIAKSGGTVDANTGHIHCPAHNIAFDQQGRGCPHPIYQQHACRLRLLHYPTVEQHGMIFVYLNGNEPAEPEFSLPHIDLSHYLPLLTVYQTISAETAILARNSVDLAHFSAVHGYNDAVITENISVSDRVLSSAYSFKRPYLWNFGELNVSISVKLYGPSYNIVRTRLEELDVEFTILLMFTPIDAGSAIHAGIIVDRRTLTGKFIPKKILEFVVPHLVKMFFKRDIKCDYPIWCNQYGDANTQPLKGDGPFALFNNYVTSFVYEATSS